MSHCRSVPQSASARHVAGGRSPVDKQQVEGCCRFNTQGRASLDAVDASHTSSQHMSGMAAESPHTACHGSPDIFTNPSI